MITLAAAVVVLDGSADLLSLFPGVSCSCVPVETKCLMMVTLLEIGALMQFNSNVSYKYLQLERERKCWRYLGEKCCLLIRAIEMQSSDQKKNQNLKCIDSSSVHFLLCA